MQYLTDHDLAGERGCILSDCGTYRYRLYREWDKSRPTVAFLMLNPSTADHLTDDPTITRCMSRAIAGKFGRLEVANLFPLRATDPGELLTHPDLLGPKGSGISADGAILDAIDKAHTVICAWGAHAARCRARRRGFAAYPDDRYAQQAIPPRAEQGRQPEAPALHRRQHATQTIRFHGMTDTASRIIETTTRIWRISPEE